MSGADWISVRDRLPGPADGDDQQCVIVWHIYNGAMCMGWHQVERNRFITHWQPCPPAPKGCKAVFFARSEGTGI